MVQEVQLDLASTKTARIRQPEFLRNAIHLGWSLLILSAIFQVLFYPSLVNLLCIASVVLGWVVLVKTYLRVSMLTAFPLSSFVMIAFVASQLYLPLVFTTVEGKSLINNLELPDQVFFHALAQLAILLLFHAFYRLLSKISERRSYSILAKTGFFTPPTHLQLWAMGFIGVGATFYIYFSGTETGWETTGSPIEKAIQALMPFSYAPFFIPFGELFGNNQKPPKRIGLLLVLFGIALFATSIGRNSRGAFMFGFTSVAFGYILGLLLGHYKTKFFTARNIFFAGMLCWLLIGPVADLGTAMVIVRGDREEQELSGGELLDQTLDMYWDKEAIVSRRQEDNGAPSEPDWDERYLDNIFIARFANIKFNDMSLIQYTKLRKYDPDMLQYSYDWFLSQFPDPVIKFFDIDVDKEVVLDFSFGDYIYIAAGGHGIPHSYRTGHFAGTGMATFGWWYLPILGVLMIPVFWVFDKFYMRKNPNRDSNQPDDGGPTFVFSFCGMLSLTSIFQFLPPESVVAIGAFLFRGYIQLIFLYFVIFHVTRIVTGPVKLRWR